MTDQTITYKTLVSALDGRKYLEETSCKQSFFNTRHKPSCLKNGILRVYMKKREGVYGNAYNMKEICQNCGHETYSSSSYFSEDEVK